MEAALSRLVGGVFRSAAGALPTTLPQRQHQLPPITGEAMNIVSKIALALVTAASCTVAVAQTYSSDAERRAANREQALERYRASQGTTAARSSDRTTDSDRSAGAAVRETTHKAAQATRKAARSTRNFTHRQLEKSRAFKARQDARGNPGATPSVHAPRAIGR